MQIQARLDELNASIDPHDAHGELLEELAEDAATEIPSWELGRCWRYEAWPTRADFRLPPHEDGIDLVAAKTDGDLVAIQCKARSSGNVTPTDIQKFAGKANPRIFQERWLVATTEPTSGDERALSECDVIWKNGLIDLRQTADERPEEAEPDPTSAMQDEAVKNCISVPCGTRKTRISMRIANDLCPDGPLAVVLVPSIALVAVDADQPVAAVPPSYTRGLEPSGHRTPARPHGAQRRQCRLQLSGARRGAAHEHAGMGRPYGRPPKELSSWERRPFLMPSIVCSQRRLAEMRRTFLTDPREEINANIL